MHYFTLLLGAAAVATIIAAVATIITAVSVVKGLVCRGAQEAG